MSNEAHVFIRNRSGHPLPAYATPSSAGMDVRAKLKLRLCSARRVPS